MGCGRGATLLPAADRVGPGGRVLGVDLSEQMTARLQSEVDRRELAQASVRRADAQALPVDAGSFDIVLCSFVLHLLPEPDRAAAGIVRALRAGGRCVAASPTGLGDDWDFMTMIVGAHAQRAGHPMVVPFRPQFDVAEVLVAAGLDVTETVSERAEFSFSDEQAWWDWAWTQGMRGVLEVLSAADLEALRQDLFAGLGRRRTATGITMTPTAAFVVAEKRAG